MHRSWIVLLVLVISCGPTQPRATSTTGDTGTAASERTTTSRFSSETSPLIGFAFSPASLAEADVVDFFETASGYGSLIAWVGPWEDIDSGGIVIFELAARYDYTPIVVTGFPSDPAGGRVIPDDPDELIETVGSWVAEHPVTYLGFGVEVDMHLWEESTGDFDWYVDVFARVADEVHRVSPETKVFPGFQLERLRGLKGGLFGGEEDEPAWDLIQRFPAADAIGFTTYPGLVFTHPADIPDDYYAEVAERIDLPIVFTEVGWQAGGDVGPWSGSPEKQAAFVADWMPELISVSDMVIWSYLWDQEGAPPVFDTMGLIDQDDIERPGLEAWRELDG